MLCVAHGKIFAGVKNYSSKPGDLPVRVTNTPPGIEGWVQAEFTPLFSVICVHLHKPAKTCRYLSLLRFGFFYAI